MEDDVFDEPAGAIRCVAASVRYDGMIDVGLAVPGYDEPQTVTFPGNDATVMMTWDDARPIALEGGTAADARCREIIDHHVARLQLELERQRRVQERRRTEHLAREREYSDVG